MLYFLQLIDVQLTLPVSKDIIARFVVHMHEMQLKTNTIRQNLSGIAYVHKMLELPDNTAAFIVKKLLDVCKSEDTVSETRRPITASLLAMIIPVLYRVTQSQYDLCMYKSLFTFMYAACLRVGEAIASGTNLDHVLKLSQLQFIMVNQELVGCRVLFLSYKHSKGKTPSILLEPKQGHCCPLKNMLQYLSLRGRADGYIFVDQKGELIMAVKASKVLKAALVFLDYKPEQYSMHSFRAGKCTDLAVSGATTTQMRLAGRWDSNAFDLYIKPEEIVL